MLLLVLDNSRYCLTRSAIDAAQPSQLFFEVTKYHSFNRHGRCSNRLPSQQSSDQSQSPSTEPA